MSAATSNGSNLIDIRQLSTLSGRSVSSLRRDVREGRLEAFQPGGPGGKLFFRPDALEQCRVTLTSNRQSLQIPDAASGSRPPRLSGRLPAWMTVGPTAALEPKSED
jgi:hypothetical protein